MRCPALLGIFLLFLLTRAQAPLDCPPQYNVTLAATSDGGNVVAVRREATTVDNGNSINNLNIDSCWYIILPE